MLMPRSRRREGNNKLRVLDLRYNRICDKAALKLKDLMKHCPRLSSIDIRFNDISYRRECEVMGSTAGGTGNSEAKWHEQSLRE